MSDSISISAPSSVYQQASTSCSSMVSRWKLTATRIRPRLAASKTASTLSPLWYRIVISIAVLSPAYWSGPCGGAVRKFVHLFGYGSGVLRREDVAGSGASFPAGRPLLALRTGDDLLCRMGTRPPAIQPRSPLGGARHWRRVPDRKS